MDEPLLRMPEVSGSCRHHKLPLDLVSDDALLDRMHARGQSPRLQTSARDVRFGAGRDVNRAGVWAILHKGVWQYAMIAT